MPVVITFCVYGVHCGFRKLYDQSNVTEDIVRNAKERVRRKSFAWN